MSLKPTVTVCSDASHSFKYGVATWACYIRTPRKTIKTGGVLKQKVNGSTTAERLGLANALFITNNVVDLSKHKLIVYCDNMYALEKPKVNKTPASKHYAKKFESKKWFEEFVEPYLTKAASYETRHVKGHLKRENWDKTSKRNYMNDWCDKEAARLRQAEVRKLRKGIK